MRLIDNQSIADWAKTTQESEYTIAIKRINAGENLELVMQEMAERIKQKMLHYHITILKNEMSSNVINTSKDSYEENYIKKIGLRPDHVSDNS